MNAITSTRSRTPEPPYLWTSKEASRRIRNRLDGDTLQVYALAVYTALCENSSDKGEESFQTLQSHIGVLAGDISTRTVQRCLPILREIGVIDYETPKVRGPITFSLLSVPSDNRNDTPDSLSVTTRAKNRSRRTTEVTKKEPKEITKIPEVLNHADFLKAWGEWLQYRRSIKKPLTALSQEKLLATLNGMGKEKAIESINASIANGWQGLFEIREERGKSAKAREVSEYANF